MKTYGAGRSSEDIFWDDGFSTEEIAENGLGWRFGVLGGAVSRARCFATEKYKTDVVHGDRRFLIRSPNPHVPHEERILGVEHAIPPPTAFGRI